MLRKLIFCLLLCAAGYTKLLAAEPTRLYPGFPENATACDTPSAPTALKVLAVSPTSVSVSWISSIAYYYKVIATDIHSSISLPPVYGQGNQATVNGLQPGHSYSIAVSLASAPNCPYSEASTIETKTGVIIVDIVMGRSCTFGTGTEVSVGQVIGVNVPKFASEEDIVTGKFAYDYEAGVTHVLQFTMRYVPATQSNGTNSLYVNLNAQIPCIPASGHTVYVPSTQGSEAAYTFGTTGLLKAKAANFLTSQADVLLYFNRPGKISFCNREDKGTGREGDLPIGLGSARLAPNPFHTTVSFVYELEAEAMVNVEMLDAQGRTIHKLVDRVVQDAGRQEVTMNDLSLPTGLYFGVIQINGERRVYPLIKQ